MNEALRLKLTALSSAALISNKARSVIIKAAKAIRLVISENNMSVQTLKMTSDGYQND